MGHERVVKGGGGTGGFWGSNFGCLATSRLEILSSSGAEPDEKRGYVACSCKLQFEIYTNSSEEFSFIVCM